MFPQRPQSMPLVQLKNDTRRIRGDALRRSLFWTLVAWIPGAFWTAATSGGTPTILAIYLGASAFWIGLMNAAPQIAVLFQIPGSIIVTHLGRRKGFFIWTVTIHRALYIVIGLLPWLLPAGKIPSAALMVLLLLISTGLNNLGGQAWANWMADLVPERARGKYFARRNRVGIGVMAITALLLGWALDIAGQTRFAALVQPITHWSGLPPLILLVSVTFMISGAIGMLDILSFIRVDEPPMKISITQPLHRKLLTPLLDRPFRSFCIYWSVWNFSIWFSGTLWWLYVLDFFDQISKAGQHPWWMQYRYLVGFIILSISSQVGQFLGFPIWGRAVDRFGCKPVLFVSSMLHTTTNLVWIFLCPALLPWLPLLQVGAGLASAGQDIASFNTMLQFNRKGGSDYQAVGSVLFALAAAAGCVISGSLLSALSGFQLTLFVGTPWAHTFNRYALLLAISFLIKFAGDLVLLPHMQDTAAKPRRETVRFVFSNMYGTLNTIIFTPVRTGLGVTSRGITGVADTLTEVAGSNIKRWFR